MKILYVVKTNRGASWAYNQAEWIVRNRSDVEFVVAMPSVNGGYAEEYKKIGCRVITSDFSIPTKKPWKIFGKIKKIRKIVNNEQPDIIHSHFVTTTFMLRMALRKSKIKRVFQVPGPLHLENLFFRFADKILSTQQDYWVGSCKWTVQKYLDMGIPQSHLFLNYYGGVIPPIYKEGMQLHEDLHISTEREIIGMVSYFYKPKYYLLQFTGVKGHEDFIEAIALLRKKHPEAIGVIIGNAWDGAEKYEQKMHKLAKQKCGDGIVFAGYRNDVKAIYHEMTVAVHPSLSENLGGAAPSIGQCVPTISTNVGGFPDIVINGETGWTVNPHSPKEISERLAWILENKTEAKRMACQGRKLYENMLSIENTGNNMFTIYKMILDEK